MAVLWRNRQIGARPGLFRGTCKKAKGILHCGAEEGKKGESAEVAEVAEALLSRIVEFERASYCGVGNREEFAEF